MKLNRIDTLIQSSLMLAVMALGLLLLSSADAFAQGRSGKNNGKQDNRSNGRYDDRDIDRNGDRGRGKRDDVDDIDVIDDDNARINGRDRRGSQSIRFAYDRGYKAGLKEARNDSRNNNRRRGVSSSSGIFGNGNRNGWGNSPEFEQAYREGYERGYRDGLDRYR